MNANGTYKNPLFAPLPGHGRRRRIRTSSSRARFRPTTTTRAGFRTRSRPRTSAAASTTTTRDPTGSSSAPPARRSTSTTRDWTYETKYAGLALERQDARVVVVHRQLDEGARLDGHRHPGLRQSLLRGSAAARTAPVQADRRRPARLSGRLLPGGEQLHAADDQHRPATRASRPAADGGLDTTNLQAQSSVTSVKGTHTLRGGVDYRLAMRRAGLMTAGNVSSTYNFDNTYTRAADTTAVFPTSNIGPSLAALMLGIPTSVSIGQNAPISMSNPYYGGFFQDTWRATVQPHAQLRSPLRVRGRHQGVPGSLDDRVRSGRARWRSPTWRRPPTRAIRFRRCR